MPKKKIIIPAWKRHDIFETGMDRLQYVYICHDEYVDRLLSDTQATIEKKIDLPRFLDREIREQEKQEETELDAKYFFTHEDIILHGKRWRYMCVGCSHEAVHPNWMKNIHLLGTYSPICESCGEQEIL